MIVRSLCVLLALTCASRVMSAQVADAKTCGVAPGQNLSVFVGKKLSVRPFQPAVKAGRILLDYAFRVRYRVLQVFCGEPRSPEIEFDVYDHYGTPPLAAFETVLLFVSRDSGRFVQQKYQFAPVFETTDGAWAGCGDPYQCEPEVHRRRFQARSIAFKHPPEFSVKQLSENEIRERYPPAFFTRRNDVVVCRAGATLAEIFWAKRNGVLKARGLFR